MKKSNRINHALVVLLAFLLISCEDFLEIEEPNHMITSEIVFSDDETALSAMEGIHNQLASVFFSSGGSESVTILSGLSADELSPIRTTNLPYMEFEQHEILPDNFRNLNLWASAYNMIYLTNSLLEGLADASNLSEQVSTRLEGEARFVRAFAYFYLVNLYGEVPLILSTDYRINALASRDSKEEIYRQMELDLRISMDLLNDGFTTGERTEINRFTAIALLARLQLYLGEWEDAEDLSTQVIAQNSTYEILENLDQVFLKNSREAIWQLSPKGRGSTLTQTNEGSNLIIHPTLSFLSHLKLEDNFTVSFGEEDLRRLSWINFHQGTGNYYSYKYKIRNSSEEITEYSMVMRLAEQYLIRAEARAMLGNLKGAISDLDKIRERAGLELITDARPGMGKEEFLNLIFLERKKELFTEWGHRWLDLKRRGTAGETLSDGGSFWEETDTLYPIPESERMKNPNLTQNDGY